MYLDDHVQNCINVPPLAGRVSVKQTSASHVNSWLLYMYMYIHTVSGKAFSHLREILELP